jgi:hypothetical protein
MLSPRTGRRAFLMLAFSTVVAIAAAVGSDALAPSVSRTYCGNDI